MNTPPKGYPVLYHQGDNEQDFHIGDERFPADASHPGTNGTRVHPAIITNASDGGRLNLCVFIDGVGPVVRMSVRPARDPGETTAEPDPSGYWTDVDYGQFAEDEPERQPAATQGDQGTADQPV